MAKAKGGKSPARIGRYNELKAVKELNREFKRLGSDLRAERCWQSGALGHLDARHASDLRIVDARKAIVERVEVKSRDPVKSGSITIATMENQKWRKHRRCLMARHTRGDFVCSIWASVWDDLCESAGEEPTFLDCREVNTRGVTINHLQDMMLMGMAVAIGSAFYLPVRAFAELLHAAYGGAQ